MGRTLPAHSNSGTLLHFTPNICGSLKVLISPLPFSSGRSLCSARLAACEATQQLPGNSKHPLIPGWRVFTAGQEREQRTGQTGDPCLLGPPALRTAVLSCSVQLRSALLSMLKSQFHNSWYLPFKLGTVHCTALHCTALLFSWLFTAGSLPTLQLSAHSRLDKETDGIGEMKRNSYQMWKHSLQSVIFLQQCRSDS